MTESRSAASHLTSKGIWVHAVYVEYTFGRCGFCTCFLCLEEVIFALR